MLGDNDHTLIPACHIKLEAEANFAAARLLFLRERFRNDALDTAPCFEALRTLAKRFGNTHSTTFWRCIEAWGEHRPMIGLITAHPHPDRRPADFDPNAPCKHFIQRSEAHTSELQSLMRISYAVFCLHKKKKK